MQSDRARRQGVDHRTLSAQWAESTYGPTLCLGSPPRPVVSSACPYAGSGLCEATHRITRDGRRGRLAPICLRPRPSPTSSFSGACCSASRSPHRSGRSGSSASAARSTPAWHRRRRCRLCRHRFRSGSCRPVSQEIGYPAAKGFAPTTPKSDLPLRFCTPTAP